MPAFPKFATRLASASAATLSPAKPVFTGNSGGVLLAVVTSKNNAVHATATAGWTRIGAQINSGASFTASLWIASETAAAPVFTWTGAAACSAQVMWIADGKGPMDASVSASSNASGTAATHTSASFNSTRDNARAVYVDVTASNSALATPSGWTEDLDGGSATDAGRTVWGSKQLGVAGSASGAISVTGGAAAWVQWQVELRIALGDALQSSKMEGSAWLEPGDGLDMAKMEVSAWLDSPSEVSASKIEVSAWLDPFGGGGRRRQLVNPV